MINVTEKELEIVKGIISEYASDYDVLGYGSRYDGTAEEYSDLDLAFVGGRLDLKKRIRLEEAFAKSGLPYRVYVLDYNSVSQAFREIIDGGNELIFKRVRK